MVSRNEILVLGPSVTHSAAMSQAPHVLPSANQTLPDVQAVAVHRLGVAALVFSALAAVALTARLVVPLVRKAAVPPPAWSYAPALLIGLLGVAIYYLTRKDENHARVLRLGAIYVVVLSALTAFQYALPSWEGVTARGIPGAALCVLFLPMLVSTNPRQALIIAMLGATTVPLSLLAVHYLGPTAPPMRTFVIATSATYFSALLAWVGARLVHQLRVRVWEARQMGSYLLLEKLAQGGMGEVWRAKHALLARPAALKLIRTDNRPDAAELRERFEREAQATAELCSPHTVRLYDFGVSEEGTFFYAMELLDGADLFALVKRYGAMEPARVVHILQQACHSLGEAHERGLVHQDIKPENIFLARYGRDVDVVKVLDFGIVKTAHCRDDEDENGAVRGSPAYMAPERSLGQSDARADIYSLGCVAFHLLTGRDVFIAANASQAVFAHAEIIPDPPSKHAPGPLPAGLDALILSCLQKDPAARPQSVDDIYKAVTALQIEPVWTQERAKQWWSEHPLMRDTLDAAAQRSLTVTRTHNP